MQTTTIHPRHAVLVEHLGDYLTEIGKSARWLGLKVARDARLVPNLKRGQVYPPAVMLNLHQRLLKHYEAQLAAERGEAGQPFMLAA